MREVPVRNVVRAFPGQGLINGCQRQAAFYIASGGWARVPAVIGWFDHVLGTLTGGIDERIR